MLLERRQRWTVREVADDDRLHGFCARSVVLHDRGVHNNGWLVFFNINRGLLFHPRLTTSHFINLPDAPKGSRGGEVHEGDATVDSSEGRIVCVVFYEVLDDGMMVGLWWLSKEDLC